MSTGRQAKQARQALVRARGSAYGVNDKPVTTTAKPARKPKKPKKPLDLWRLLYDNPRDPYGGDRLKLPSGETVRLPDRNHPGAAALKRILDGNEQPEDRQLFSTWKATMDPRYVAYMDLLTLMPKRSEQMVTGPSKDIGNPLGARVVLQRFADAVNTGAMEMCVHVRQQAPHPAHWVAWAPGKLRCHDCAMLESRRIKGGKEDYTCDACGHVTRKHIQAVTKMTPPIVYRRIIVPVFLVFGLCRNCLAEPGSTEGVSQSD